MASITFYVVNRQKAAPPQGAAYPCVLLYDDNWDDFGFKTYFDARLYLQPDEDPKELDGVRILQKGLGEQSSRTKLPKRFTILSDQEYCSLGATMKYYEKIFPKNGQ